jgi:restriction system protein
MARRRPSNLDTLLQLPWWVSAGIGVLLFIVLTTVNHRLATTGGPMGAGMSKAFDVVPIATLVFFSLVAAGAGFLRWKRGDRLEAQRSLESLRSLPWQEFESLVAEAFRRKGFSVEKSLVGGADGGVDLALHKDGETTLVQCKQWRTQSVGVPTIREQYGLLMHEQAQRVMVVTSGTFTPEARAFAKGKPMELIDGPQLFELVRGVQSHPAAAADVTLAPSAPACPKCGSTMVTRTAKRGAKAGSSFWGCPKYPGCTGTRNFEH